MNDDQIRQLVRVKCAEDRSSASIAIAPGMPVEDVTEALLGALLAERGLADESIDHEAVADLVSAYAADSTSAHERVVASGVPPQHGLDARLTLEDRFQSTSLRASDGAMQAGSDADRGPKGAIDHYSRTAFVVIHEGEVLGRIEPPTQGVDGQDIYGRVLAAKPGKRLPITIDASVEVTEPDHRLVARNSGVLEHTAITLRVNPTLEIREWIDFSTGNIDFPGDVDIRRGIKDCFAVRVGRDLHAGEFIEAANISVGRDAFLLRGMAGREKGTLRVARDLDARYLDGVIAEVGRDCVVKGEINNTHLRVGRALDSPKARVVGSTVVVGERAEVGQVAGETGIPASLHVTGRTLDGTFHKHAQTLLPQLRAELEDAKRELDAIRSVTGRIAATRLAELQTLVAMRAARLDQALRAVRSLVEQAQQGPAPTLTIQRLLFTSASLQVGPFRFRPRNHLKGPLTICAPSDGSEPWFEDLLSQRRRPLAEVGALDTDTSWVSAATLDALIRSAA
ncbi:MAG: DUF342 domain-containing protein [Phycisphaeraceae bacterium]|nr:DUF342 domain-containing protein [Phycisphaeraceae bacterium]